MIVDRDSAQGTWTLAGGTIHHLALNTGDEENQLKLRAHIEGLGFTDISEQKDRNYFKSCYVRSPGGALFELAWTTPEGWAKDEPARRDRQDAGVPAVVQGPRGRAAGGARGSRVRMNSRGSEVR